MLFFSFVPALKKPTIPEVDVAFAISSASSDATEVRRQSKAVIKSLIDTYGMEKLKIALIAYGSISKTLATFQDTANFADKELIRYLDRVQAVSGEPNLKAALVNADELLRDTGRPNAKKILVVISDKK